VIFFRVENGKIGKHWDTIEKRVPASNEYNSSEKFNL
jgi:predicted SnoaL-like aldol condensation-catalyzing enzyme